MPKFSQVKVEDRKRADKSIPPAVLEEYTAYIEQLEAGHEGVLTFDAGEDMRLARRALVEAGVACKKYVKVRKARGTANVLLFRRITKTVYDQWLKKNKLRAERIRAGRSARASTSA